MIPSHPSLFLHTTFPYSAQEFPQDIPYEFAIYEALEAFRDSEPASKGGKVLTYDGEIPIPRASPFFGLPWLLFKPNHTGFIPEKRGVSYDYFKKCEETYRLIVEGKTSIKVLDSVFEPDFKAKILHCLKLALIRPTSRNRLLNLVSLVNVTITIRTGNSSSTSYTYSESDIEVKISTRRVYLFTLKTMQDHPMPTVCHLFIELMHELTHAEGMILYPRQFEWLFTQRPIHRIDTDNREEERVIFEENKIRAEFREDYKFQCRRGHSGFEHRTQVPENRPSFYVNCFSGALDLIQDTMKSGFDPNAYLDCQEGPSPSLIIAARQGHFAVVDYFLECKANPFNISSKGETFPHALIRAGSLAELQKHVNNGNACIRTADQVAVPLLHTALIELREQAWPFLKYLMEEGADPRRLCPAGYNILHHAATIADPTFFDYFAGLGINPYAVAANGETPLHLALLYGNLLRAKRLLKPDHSLRQFTVKGDSLLTYALASFSEETVAWVLQMEQERALLAPNESYPPLIHTVNYFGESPLHLAMAKYFTPRHRRLIGHWIASGIVLGNVDSPLKPKEVQSLFGMFSRAESPYWQIVFGILSVQNRTWIEEPWCYGSTLLNFAAAKGNLPLLNFVINLGVSLNRTDVPHPLFGAIENNQVESITVLMIKGSNPYQKYKEQTPLEYAIQLQSEGRPLDPRIVPLLAAVPQVPY